MISVQPSALQKITARHLSRQAMLYVRQSTLHQVLELGVSEMREKRTGCSFQVVIGMQAPYACTLSKIGDMRRGQQPCAFQSKYQPYCVWISLGYK